MSALAERTAAGGGAPDDEPPVLLLMGRDGSLHRLTAQDLAQTRVSPDEAERLLKAHPAREICWWTEWRLIPLQ